MNQVFGDKDSQVLRDSTETADLSTRQVWVKPVLERLSLQDALNGSGKPPTASKARRVVDLRPNFRRKSKNILPVKRGSLT